MKETLKISIDRVGFILHEHLSNRKQFSKWVPRLRTVYQKHQRIYGTESYLGLARENRTDFVHGCYNGGNLDQSLHYWVKSALI